MCARLFTLKGTFTSSVSGWSDATTCGSIKRPWHHQNQFEIQCAVATFYPFSSSHEALSENGNIIFLLLIVHNILANRALYYVVVIIA